MKKAKYIFVVLYIIAALAVAYFGYSVVRERYFSPEKKGVEKIKSDGQNPASDQASGDQEQAASASDIDNTPPTNGQPNVQTADCDNNCKNFKDNADNLKYCRQVCGITPVTPKNSEGDCANLTGLDRDSCWRDLAVSKKDFSICDKISDAKLQKVCHNRVTEEILN
ncbi:MAG TPA: hypothetical protein VK254_00205 [Candidatus Bathyarchaeia archaeon]|nr:hypothetical protein [Candidatus Bathyarchaeia archaeon]